MDCEIGERRERHFFSLDFDSVNPWTNISKARQAPESLIANKDEATVPGRHCRADTTVRMRKERKPAKICCKQSGMRLFVDIISGTPLNLTSLFIFSGEEF